MAEYKAKLKTVEKWEKDLKVKFSKDLEGDFVPKVKVCYARNMSILSVIVKPSHKFGSMVRSLSKKTAKTFERGSTQKSQRTRA